MSTPGGWGMGLTWHLEDAICVLEWFGYTGSAFLAPQQFLSCTSLLNFPGRFPAFAVLEVGLEESTELAGLETPRFTWQLSNPQTALCLT